MTCLLLDKTGTITFGNRLAAEIIPVAGASQEDAVKAALWSSLGDETPEGRSIVALARQLGAEAPEGSVERRPAPKLVRSRRRRG